MSAEYSVDEKLGRIEAVIQGLRPSHNAYITQAVGLLRDYAERIAAAGSAVTAEVVQKAVQAFATSLLQQREEGGSGHHKDMRAALLAVWPNPPAQAAQVCSCCGRGDALETRCTDCGEVQTVYTTAPTAEPVAQKDKP